MGSVRNLRGLRKSDDNRTKDHSRMKKDRSSVLSSSVGGFIRGWLFVRLGLGRARKSLVKIPSFLVVELSRRATSLEILAKDCHAGGQ
jgi:hypothetical protein